MTFNDYGACLKIIIQILKKKYTNLTAEEALTMATDIMNGIIHILGLEQE